MSENNNYSVTFLVDKMPKEAFDAIINPRGWWSQAIEGDTDKLGAVFKYHYQDIHRTTLQITELVPEKRVVWHVMDNYFNFIQDKNEWIGTDIVFEIQPKGNQTEVHFTHVGLVPAYECYDVCSNAWGTYITRSLRDLIATGEGHPNPIEEVVSKAREMRGDNYAVSFTVDQSPEEVFAAVNNPRGWWSEAIEGDTDRLGSVFKYHYRDVHRATFQITELVPNKKVVWHVMDNDFNFIQDKNEWVGTDIVFEMERKGDQTELHFTHIGLVPMYECYEVCSNAWGTYISRSLRDLITTGKGHPNPIEEVVDKAREMLGNDYTASFTVDQSPDEVFAAVNNVRGWWSGNIDGDTDKLGAEFKFHSGDVHYSTQKITEFVPGKKVVWHVTESRLNFIQDKSEWTGTDIVFEIGEQNDKTELRFTHVGLVPVVECYSMCSNAWGFYVKQSLFDLITKGKASPDPKDKGEQPIKL